MKTKPENRGRINLNFNLDDEREFAAYCLLQQKSKSRKATSFITEMLLAQLAKAESLPLQQALQNMVANIPPAQTGEYRSTAQQAGLNPLQQGQMYQQPPQMYMSDQQYIQGQQPYPQNPQQNYAPPQQMMPNQVGMPPQYAHGQQPMYGQNGMYMPNAYMQPPSTQPMPNPYQMLQDEQPRQKPVEYEPLPTPFLSTAEERIQAADESDFNDVLDMYGDL